MARFRRSLHPVNRIKHVIDSEGALAAGAQSVTPIAVEADNPDLANVTQVLTGAHVSSIYLHVEVSHTSGAGRPNMYFALVKNPAQLISPITGINSVGDSGQKKFFIHQEMIMLSGDAGNGLPRPIFNGVIKIPKHMQRFAPNDTLDVVLLSPTVVGDFCLQCHYKEIR